MQQRATYGLAVFQRWQPQAVFRRWRFEGEDRFETELLEFVFGEGLVPLTSWTYTRTRGPSSVTPSR